MTLLSADELADVLDRTRHDLFRIETMPSYDTTMTTPDFQRWLAGESQPNWSVRQPWLDTLTRWAQAGRPRRRVRVIHNPITKYERYACEWGYRYNVPAGEPTRVIDLADRDLPAELADTPGDWWLIDDREVVTMHYHADGRFNGAEVLPASSAAPYRHAAATAWHIAEDFTAWWSRHPEYSRTHAA